MSSVLHQDKSREEIEIIVQNFIDHYYRVFGHKPDQKIIEERLREYKEKRESEMFSSMFSKMTLKNLNDANDSFKTELKRRK